VCTLGDPRTFVFSRAQFSLSLQSLLQWSKVMGMELIAHEGFANHLEELLQGPAGNSEVVLDLVLEVIQSSPGAFIIYNSEQTPAPSLERILVAILQTMQALLPGVQEMAGRTVLCLEEADACRLARWAKVAGALVEAYTQLLWVDSVASGILISFLGSCFVVHPHIAQSAFEPWAVLKEANRDSLLPAGVLAGLIRQLAPPCIASFLRFGRFDSPYAQDPSELSQLRDSLQDILTDMFCVAASMPEVEVILSLLLESLQSAEAKQDWCGVEVVWFAFAGIAEVLADEPQIPEVYHTVLLTVFRTEPASEEQCATAVALLRACGPHFEHNLQQHLVPAVQRLVSLVPRVPAAAGEAVQELCGHAGQHLLPHVGDLLKIVVNVAPSVPTDVDASLHGALVGIIRSVERDKAVDAFVQICSSGMATLSSGVDITQEAGRQTLHRCISRLLRCTLVMEQGLGAKLSTK
jgi:hypothetical protein